MNFRFLSNHMLDLDGFSSVNLTDSAKPIYLCHPVCYFYLKNKKMLPLAIQLTANEQDPIFTPNDDVFERVLQKFYSAPDTRVNWQLAPVQISVPLFFELKTNIGSF